MDEGSIERNGNGNRNGNGLGWVEMPPWKCACRMCWVDGRIRVICARLYDTLPSSTPPHTQRQLPPFPILPPTPPPPILNLPPLPPPFRNPTPPLPPHPPPHAQNPPIRTPFIKAPFPQRPHTERARPPRLPHLDACPRDHGRVVGAQRGGGEEELHVGEPAGGEEGVESREKEGGGKWGGWRMGGWEGGGESGTHMVLRKPFAATPPATTRTLGCGGRSTGSSPEDLFSPSSVDLFSSSRVLSICSAITTRSATCSNATRIASRARHLRSSNPISGLAPTIRRTALSSPLKLYSMRLLPFPPRVSASGDPKVHA